MIQIHLTSEDQDLFVVVADISFYYDRQGLNNLSIVTYIKTKYGQTIYTDQNAKQIKMRIDEALKQ